MTDLALEREAIALFERLLDVAGGRARRLARGRGRRAGPSCSSRVDAMREADRTRVDAHRRGRPTGSTRKSRPSGSAPIASPSGSAAAAWARSIAASA